LSFFKARQVNILSMISTWVEKGSVTSDLAILGLAVTVGLSIGAIPFRGLRLGIAGVLFSSLIFRQCGLAIDPKVLDFLRDFALIVFMYAIGLQVGPGFGASLRSEGLRLNILSICALVLGGLLTAAITPLLPNGTAPGLYCGAFTTTPGLAAAQEALRAASSTGAGAAATALAYSITYPFGVVGPMLVVLAIQRLFRVHMGDERASLAKAEQKRHASIDFVDIEVTAPEFAGKCLQDEPLLHSQEIIVTRVLRDGVATSPTADTRVKLGDVYRAVGPKERLPTLIAALGRPSPVDLSTVPGDLGRSEFVVTRRHALHRSLRELDLRRRVGVTIGIVHRAGVDLVPTASLRLAFADRVTAVGPKKGLELAEAELGNCVDALQHAQLAPIFLGIVVGVVLGSLPLELPNLHGALHIGLAAGSLFAAIALSRLRSFGSVIWYMPAAANQLFRDFGLAIFLACVGFQAGDHFIQRAAHNSGFALLAWGAVVTLVPVFIVGCYARLVMRMNFINLAGWIAGVMSSSTTLQFASEITSSNSPAIVYAAVIPLAELMPIISAQLLALMAAHH
jgi:putative transport protein